MGAQAESGSDADDVFAGAGSDGRRAWRRRPLGVAGGSRLRRWQGCGGNKRRGKMAGVLRVGMVVVAGRAEGGPA